jgi:hypothetical protein
MHFGPGASCATGSQQDQVLAMDQPVAWRELVRWQIEAAEEYADCLALDGL